MLEGAGLVRIVESRPVRGGTEHYYQRSARRFAFDGPDVTPAMVRAVADDLAGEGAERHGIFATIWKSA